MFGQEKFPAPFVEPKVLVITFAPVVHDQAGKRLYEANDWNDPRELMPGYIHDVQACSHGYVRYRIVDEIEVDAFPVKLDGFRYTTASFQACLAGEQPWHQPDAVDYRAIFKQFNVLGRFRRREIDDRAHPGPLQAGGLKEVPSIVSTRSAKRHAPSCRTSVST